jgi:hypothetical protein
MNPDDYQTQIDTINQELDDMSSSFSDISDSIDQNLSDQETTDGDFEQRMSTLEDSSGQLLFPLTQDTIDLITEQSPAILSNYYGQGYAGSTTLIAGTKTVTNSFITANSLIFLTASTPGGTQGFLSYVASAGQVIINSSSGSDTSVVNFIIINPK